MSAGDIVVTGRGVLTPVGEGVEDFWQALMEGRCGVAGIRRTNPTWYRNPLGYEIALPDPLVPDRPDLGRTASLMVRAARGAVTEAGPSIAQAYAPERCGVVVGSALLELRRAEDLLFEGRAPADYVSGFSLSATLGRELGFAGPNTTLANACGSGGFAVALAADWIELGRLDCAVAVGCDTITESMYGLADRANPRKPRFCAPFDRAGAGPLLAEGSAALVLERRSSAEARGARLRGCILGAGLACDAMSTHAPSLDGVARTISAAIVRAGVRASEIDYVCAHGTGTEANDRVETEALKRVLGERAYAVPISSLKSMLGHASGASTAIALVAALLAVERGRVPPTIHLEAPGEGLDLDYVPGAARDASVSAALVNGFGFGGTNVSIVVGRVEHART